MVKRGEFLVKIMEEKGFNTMSLAKASGVPYTTIRSMIERDLSNASIDNVLKICKVLNIEAEALADPETWLAKEKEKQETIAAHRTDDLMDELPEEAKKSLEEFKMFLLKKHGIIKE